MLKSLGLALGLAVSLFLGSCGGPSGYGGGASAPPGATIITIANAAESLGAAAYGATIHVASGTQISFYNGDTMTHTATTYSAPAAFDSGYISPGNYSAAITITTAGTYQYDCTIHGILMTGELISP